MTDRPWFCGRCGAEFNVAMRVVDMDDGITEVVRHACPVCGDSGHIERMVACPVCHNSWKSPFERLCRSCEKHAKSELRRFVHGLQPAEMAYIDDLLDGESLTRFL